MGLDFGTIDELEREASDALARRPEVVEDARGDPASFVERFCWGVDFEKREVFKARLWPWQRSLLRYLARIDEFDGSPYQADPRDPVRLIILKSRGVGATWAVLWYVTWLAWARPPAEVLLESDIDDKAVALMRRHEFVVENLPPSLPYPTIPRGNLDNMSTKEYDNGSQLYSLTGNPNNIRMHHPTFLVLDEHAQFRQRAMPSVMGLDSDVVAVSTANGFGNEFAEVWHDAEHAGGAEWGYRPLFVSWRDRPERKRRPKGRPDLVRQEYPQTPKEAFITTGEAFFPLEMPEQLAGEHLREPVSVEDNGRLLIWTPPRRGRAYIIAADVAEGKTDPGAPPSEGEKGGRDFSAAVVRDWRSGEQVAEFHGRLPEIEFANKLYALRQRYPGLIVPERNATGAVVAQRLIDLDGNCVLYDRSDNRAGWRTTVTSRREALALLRHLMESGGLKCPSKGFWSEVRTFQYQRSGQPAAAAGYHDDRIMAWAISEWVRLNVSPPALPGQTRGPLPAYGFDWDPMTRKQVRNGRGRPFGRRR